MEIKIMRNVLDKNQNKADEIRQLLKEKQITMFNFISSPGSGKTTILELICQEFAKKIRLGIIEGDAYTDRDAKRLAIYDVPVVQINTEGTCHLDSHSISKALEQLNLDELDVIIVENVGNLICPTAFDLGEHYRIAVVSTTEGDDKPIKYPMLFRESHAVILNKTDLIPYTNFSMEQFNKDLKSLNGSIPVFNISSTKKNGLHELMEWFGKCFKRVAGI
ncbi:hydrogenase nickel incorporation protein HypB [Salinivirga cyanobacteriivorans]|nr:hydrogenase nickel incorporation protein HypB [Salinivirga cyanobacteriivorans]